MIDPFEVTRCGKLRSGCEKDLTEDRNACFGGNLFQEMLQQLKRHTHCPGTTQGRWPAKASTVMIKIDRILCPTDLTLDSEQALGYALALARAYDAKLVVCHCVNAAEIVGIGVFRASPALPTGEVAYTLSHGRVKELFEGSLLKLLGPIPFSNLDWEAIVVEAEDVGETITQIAREQTIDLVVMRSRRRPHRAAVLGSTAESVCRTAPCPVLVTHLDERDWVDQSGDEHQIKRVLAAYDFSDYSELALKYALSLAQEHQAELHLLHVLPRGSVRQPEISWYPLGKDTAYHQAAKRLQRAVPPEAHLWCQIKHAVTEGQPYREILNYAAAHEIDLISLGAHGAGFGLQTLFGSNVDRVLRQAPCPVLVARPLKPAVAEDVDGELTSTVMTATSV